MMSRLKKSNKRLTLPLHRWAVPRGGVIRTGPALVALRDRIPSSPMPGPTLGESGRGQPAPPDQPVLGERIHDVLTTGRNKSTRRRPKRRNHVPIKLDNTNQTARARPA